MCEMKDMKPKEKMQEVLPSVAEVQLEGQAQGQWDGCTALSSWTGKVGTAGRRVVVPWKCIIVQKNYRVCVKNYIYLFRYICPVKM